MELRQLEAFVAVAAAQSFTRAADELSLTQPAVTRQILALEKELGTRLLDRLGRRVELTEAGRALHAYAGDMLRLADESRRVVADIAHGASGRLSIAASGTAATYLLPPILGRYRQCYPLVQLSLHTSPSARVAEQVAAGDFDVGIMMTLERRERLTTLPLGEYALAAILHPDHPLARSANHGVHPSALADYGFIAMQPGATLRRHVEQCFAEASVPLTVAMETDNVETIKKMVEARLGISVLPELAVTAEADAARLIVRPLSTLR